MEPVDIEYPAAKVAHGRRRETAATEKEIINMQTIEQSIDVDVPVRTAYNQWTQFEEFPEFMEGVEEVRQIDDRRLHWVAEAAGRRHEWDAEIYEQIPDQQIAWRSISGMPNEGLVRFEALPENRTRVFVRINYEPAGALEKIGDALGIASARVKGDLKRFKTFMESRRTETGAWRGEIHGGQVNREIGSTPRSKRLFDEQSGSVGASGTSDPGMGNQ
jgi:uncharacterized membrane protein